MRIMTFALVGVLLFLVAMVVLQIFLSRRENMGGTNTADHHVWFFACYDAECGAYGGSVADGRCADQCVCCGQYSNSSAAGDLLCLPRCAAAAKGIEQNECAGSGISGTAEKSRLT